MKLFFISIVFLNSLIGFGQWSEVGETVFADPEFGNMSNGALNANGRVFANVSSGDDLMWPPTKSVAVFEQDGSEWVLKGERIPQDPDNYAFGLEIDINAAGDIVAISGVQLELDDMLRGFVKIYKYVDDEWIQMGSTIRGSADFDLFGTRISLNASGFILAASVIGSDEFGSEMGAVEVFEFIGDDWVQIGGGIPGAPGVGDFATGIDLNGAGNRLIATSHIAFMGVTTGHTLVYEYDGLVWNQIGDTFVGEEGMGSATVSINGYGDIIAIATPLENNGGESVGTVRLYQEGAGDWVQMGSDVEGDAVFSRFSEPILNWSGCAFSAACASAIVIGDEPDESFGEIVHFTWDGIEWIMGDEYISIPIGDFFGIAGYDLDSTGTRILGASPLLVDTELYGYVNIYENPMVSCEPCDDTYAAWSREACLSYTVPSRDETYEESGVYIDTIPNFCGGDSLLTITVEILPLPDVGATVSPDKICFGRSAIFNGTGASSYVWDNDVIDGLPFYPESEGTIVYTVVGTTEGEGCVNEASITLTVLPDPLLFAEHDTIIDLGGSAILTAITPSEGGFSWAPEWEVSCKDCAQIKVEPDETTYYYVEFTDQFGCKSIDSVLVYVNPQISLGVPDAFSPNGDGQNDVLFVQGVGLEAMEFQVFNRYGERVFLSQDQNVGWDGTFMNQELNAGVFTWLLHYNFSDGSTGMRKGTVTLIK